MKRQLQMKICNVPNSSTSPWAQAGFQRKVLSKSKTYSVPSEFLKPMPKFRSGIQFPSPRTNILINPTHQSQWRAENHSVRHEIPHYHFHSNTPLNPNLNQMRLFQILTICFLQIDLNIILRSVPSLPSGFFFSDVAFISHLCQSYLALFDLITLIRFGKGCKQ
jgi:hypothetical protein